MLNFDRKPQVKTSKVAEPKTLSKTLLTGQNKACAGAEFQLASRTPAVLSSIVRRLVEEVASKVLIRWGQSVRSRAIPVPLGTLELRGCCPGRSLRQSGHRSSPAGKAPLVLSSPVTSLMG
jgi:hypothetical protein